MAMAASNVATASGKNLCVQLNYSSIPTPNCARETIATSLSEPIELANYDRSGFPLHPQSGSLKQQLVKEVVCSTNKMTPGIPNKKHVPQKIDSCAPPAQKQSNQYFPPSKKSSKPSKVQSVVTGANNPAKRGNVSSRMHALPKGADESPQMCIKYPLVLCESCNSNRPLKLADYVLEDAAPSSHGKEGLGEGNDRLTSWASVSHYQSVGSSFGNQCSDTKGSFVTANVSDDSSSTGMTSGSIKAGDVHGDSVESRNSICRGSTSSNVSDESSSSSFSSSVNRPHRANDYRWEAIQAIRLRDGVLGLNHFRLLKRLGRGDIGSVYLSELDGTRSFFAMKVMDKAALASGKKLLRAQTEREILQSLDHPFLPTLYTHFETEKFTCLVMEFCPGGDLHALLQRQPGNYFPEQAARFYAAEVLLALEYLHMLGIIYRDLKTENVLVRDDGHIMLSDFDLSLRCAICPTLVKYANADMDSSKKISANCVQPACIEPTCIQPSCIQPTCFTPRFLTSRSKKENKVKRKTDVFNQVSSLPELIAEPTCAQSMSFVGTHEYLAPEIIKGEGHGSAVDWWTFGIFVYELLFGKTPFKGSGNRATLFNIVGQPLRFPETPIVSFAARDLIRGLLVKEPRHRLAYRRGATELKQHPFFQGVNWALIRCTIPPDVPKPFEVDFLPKEVQSASTREKAPAVDVKTYDKCLKIDFF